MVAVSVKSVLLILLFYPIQVQLLNILAIYPYQGKSHFLGTEPLLKELSGRGHNVTVISHFPQKKPVQNYHDISLAGTSESYENWFHVNDPSYLKIIGLTIYLLVTGTNNCKVLLSDENVQNLWKTETKFDVVLLELFNSDCALGLAHKLGAPAVGITTHSLMPYHFSRFGVPNNPSFTPFISLNGGTKPNLIQRIERTIFIIYYQYVVRIISQTIDQYTLSQYFNDIPSLEELGKKIKFLLLYEHFTFFSPSILPSNVKEVSGFHVAEVKPLPKDLEKFISESKHGVIYVSFGTTIKSSTTPPEKIAAILGAAAKLRQRVIWNWDGDSLPGKQNNVYISKWLPQNDILAHPKVVAMFSHCGLLGLTEAIFHGVPVVGMPITGDQPRNAAALEESGLGVQIQVSELNEETLLEKLKTILDTRFKEKVKLLSKMYRDRPLTAKEEAIYWIEYAARYPNASFNTAAANVPIYQYLCLDVIFIFALIFVTIFLLIRYIINVHKKKYNRTNKYRRLKVKKQ